MINKKKVKRKTSRKSALEKECDRALTEQIRRLLALPMNKRTRFLARAASGRRVAFVESRP